MIIFTLFFIEIDFLTIFSFSNFVRNLLFWAIITVLSNQRLSIKIESIQKKRSQKRKDLNNNLQDENFLVSEH